MSKTSSGISKISKPRPAFSSVTQSLMVEADLKVKVTSGLSPRKYSSTTTRRILHVSDNGMKASDGMVKPERPQEATTTKAQW
jgi:hypothetical protein